MENIVLNKIWNESNLMTCQRLPDNSIDMILTSPPYDEGVLRKYDKTCPIWTWSDFTKLMSELSRILKPGGVIVWVVDDATINGGETGTCYRQVVWTLDNTPLILHDSMIYEKNSPAYPPSKDSKRYGQVFEKVFVYTKNKIRQDIKLLCDKPNKYAGFSSWGVCTGYTKDGKYSTGKKINPVPEYSLRNNIWKYTTSCEKDKTGHPAIFPEQLAIDHILSWTNEGDIVYDPFMGSGTTAKACVLTNRKYIGSEISTEYYKIILERLNVVEKYDGKVSYNINSKKTKNKEIKESNEETSLF